jgi:hypothetical protein
MGVPAAELKTWETALSDRDWRLAHLYRIIDKRGKEVLFEPNETQRAVLANPHNRKLILKSRQHGITTLAAILSLDTALFRGNTSCGLVMHKLEDAVKVFTQKIMFAYDRIPEWIRLAVPIKNRNNTGFVEFENGSRIEVSVSHRGGTLQFLHVSEYGPMCAMFPQRAQEVKTGALNTVPVDGIVTIESTSYGGFGDFHDMCKAAMEQQALVSHGDAVLSALDYNLLFFAWWQDPRNCVDHEGVIVTKEDEDYFRKVESEIGKALSDGQRAWYVKTAKVQGEAMFREHPSTPDEAFQAAIEGGYYTSQMAQARGEGRIGRVAHEAGVPVNTFWDLGFADSVAIWFHQQVSVENRFIRSFSKSGEYLPYYCQYLQQMAAEHNYVYGTHYLPHDAASSTLAGRDVLSQLQEAFPGQRFEVVPRVANVWLGIQQTRQAFPSCYFDAVNCADGLKALDAYRKHFDARHGIFTSEPEHDEFSHYADAFRQFGQGYKALRRSIKPPAWQSRMKQLRAAHHRNPMTA